MSKDTGDQDDVHGLQNISKVFIDGRRVEKFEVKTTVRPSPTTRRASLKNYSVIQSQRESSTDNASSSVVNVLKNTEKHANHSKMQGILQ